MSVVDATSIPSAVRLAVDYAREQGEGERVGGNFNPSNNTDMMTNPTVGASKGVRERKLLRRVHLPP